LSYFLSPHLLSYCIIFFHSWYPYLFFLPVRVCNGIELVKARLHM
jgi:hypothetical protein